MAKHTTRHPGTGKFVPKKGAAPKSSGKKKSLPPWLVKKK